MILGSPQGVSPDGRFDDELGRVTLDDLFRRAVERRPHTPALIDPPDRETFTDHASRRLTYAEADHVVSAIANRLKFFNLPRDAIVAVQLPNIVESVLVLLGVLRAGLIAAPVPLLWRQSEIVAAASRIGVRALITCRRVGPVDHGELAMQVAAETFAIGFVCSFGEDIPDGVMPLDDLFEAAPEPAAAIERNGNPADHLAVVTFDATTDGIVPVARSHAELVAAGIAVMLEGRIEPDAVLLGALAIPSFAGLASTLMPWLIAGGTLALHQPFAPRAFAAQRAAEHCDVAVLPGAVVTNIFEAGLIGGRYGLQTIVAVWRAPERRAGSAPWRAPETALVDLSMFGEIGLIAGRRGADGLPTKAFLGRIAMPSGGAGGPTLIETARLPQGTLGLRGLMVPHHSFPPGTDRLDRLRLKVGQDGFVDTGYSCRVDRETRELIVDGPPAGLVSVGGYHFAMRELEQVVAGLDAGGSVAALPDPLSGHRLAGAAADIDAIRRALVEQGANPLLVGAFRGRRSGDSAA